ncbi:secreted frizzled-related protein 2 [Echinops telfairi]|uniref:Secreted frizzled-related protein 2 n=1 Tax=Echinops telfairi TaxID=9371 RepID=A0ABM0ZRW5_ECHTE|nr:secreted frizzled-related protein 2 [Echinops telfairi]
MNLLFTVVKGTRFLHPRWQRPFLFTSANPPDSLAVPIEFETGQAGQEVPLTEKSRIDMKQVPLKSSNLPESRAPKVCEACKSKSEDDNDIMETLCKNDFALKIKVKEITYINRDTKIILETKSKTIYKLNGVSERDLKKSVLWLRDSLQCTCEEMNDINAPYLVMGQKQGGELVITSVKRWQKGQREFKRISRSIRKLQC